MQYWLLKTEPAGYSIDDLKRDKHTVWTGVRNYQARNFMQQMKKGDLCFFYHSGNEKSITGIAKVVAEAHADETQFEKEGHYFEPKATKAKPMWFCVDIAFVEKFKEPVMLGVVKADGALEGMVLRAPSRLSVQPVSEKHFKYILKELA